MPKDRSEQLENRLLSQAAQGNKNAFGLLYERYQDEIYRYVSYRVGDPIEAEDITSNVFLKTWEYLPKIKKQDASIRNLRAWLYRVAKNMIIDFYRTKKPERMTSFIKEDENSTRDSKEPVIPTSRLTKAIMELEPRQQQIIVLRFINQISHKEAAEIMGLNPAHTRILQYRALKKLQEILSDESIE
jgi:RNA polymerase sigma-70 factor, ECF subfamily